jgi:translocation and assembly module TamA
VQQLGESVRIFFQVRNTLQKTALALFFGSLILGSPTAVAGADDNVRLQVELDGASGEAARNILSLLTIHKVAEEEESLSGPRVRRLHAEAEDEIRRALEPFGYYRATIDARLKTAGEVWTATYVVDVGEAIPVSILDLKLLGEGRDLEAFQAAVDAFPFVANDVLSHASYETGKKAFVALAAELGFFDAAFTAHEVRVDLESYSASIRLHYDTGPRYYFGEVRFEQDEDELDAAFLAQFVGFQRGDSFALVALRSLQAKLADSAYFRRVEVLSRPEEAEGLEVPVDVRLSANKTVKYTFGAGYGTDTGARGSASVDLRRINRNGHRGSVDLKGSEIEQSLRTTYFIPLRRERGGLLAFSAAYQEEDNDATQSETGLVGASYSRPHGRWREVFSLFLQHEDYVVGVDSGVADLLIPSVGWSRVTADDRIFPSRGYRLRCELRGAVKDAFSDASFLQASVEAKRVLSFGRRHRFLTRGEVGYVATDQFRQLPPSLRFFAGGDQSVRGFGFEALGPHDEEGQVIGAQGLIVASVEYERWFSKTLGSAVFLDAATVSDSFGGEVHSGAGLGFRWRSPVGPVRIDVAWPLSADEKSVRVHLSIGPEL